MPILSGARRALATGWSRPRTSRLRSRPSLEPLEPRVVLYSASGNAWPAPQLVTLSFMPDGTNINGKISNLQATFNARFGSTAAWENIIIKAAQTWAAQTNVNFAVVADNGAAEGSGSNQQGDPGFGDIRVGGYNFNATTLAQAFMPPPVNNYSAAGDIQFNTGQSFNSGTTYDLYTVATHEFGHALGLYHSGIASSEMYSSYNGAKSALTADDIAGIESIYSAGKARNMDTFDQGAATNNSFATASDISSSFNSSTGTGLVTGLDISSAAGADYLVIGAGVLKWNKPLTVSVQSQGLSLLSPTVTVYASDQSTVLASASGLGQDGTTLTVTTTNFNMNKPVYIKVTGSDGSVFGTGSYAIALSGGGNAPPTVPLPNTTKANGTSLSSGGGQAAKVNQETLANTTTASNQYWSGETRQNVAMDASGNFVMAWEGANSVYAQRFNAAGAKVGGEFRVNTSVANFRGYPAVAMGLSGNFVVTWSSANQDGNGYGIYAQRYDVNGNAVGGEFRVNTTTAGDQTDSVPALDIAGNLVVTWSSNGQDGSGWGIYAQRYDAAGNPLGGEFRVNTTTAEDQRYSSVAAFPGGGFVVTWASSGQDGSGYGVYAQRYDANGNPVGAEFRVNTATAGDQNAPSVAVNASGSFAITWSSSGQDGSGWGVYAQRYDSGGTPIGGEFRVNTTTTNDQRYSTPALDNAGDLLISWAAYAGSAKNWNVMAQQYAPNGTPLGGEFQLNTSTGYFQQSPSIAMNNQGQVVSAWYGGSSLDNSGVFFQQYSVSFAADSVDGFFAQGDPSDPDQAGAPAAPAPPDPAEPIVVALPPAAPAAAPAGDVGPVPQFLPPTAANPAPGKSGPASQFRTFHHDPRLAEWSARHRPSSRTSHATGHRLVSGHGGHAGDHRTVPTVGKPHPRGHAARR